jgi:hypothetical protein
LYLDENMMLSFLAHLEGGVSVSEDETETSENRTDKSATARIGARAKIAAFLSAEAAIEGQLKGSSGSSQEVQRSRHHTSASLFNILYSYLHEDGTVRQLTSQEDFENLNAGDLVEFEANYVGNPLEELVRLFGALLPLMDDESEKSKQVQAKTPSKRSGNPASRAAAASSPETSPEDSSSKESDDGVRILTQMLSDLDTVPVHDLLLGLEDGAQAVVVASSAYFSAATNEMLRAGTVKVIGKVTKILVEDDTINLTRRTILGAGGPELASATVISAASAMPGLADADPIVRAPAIQVIPMAIFV